MVIECKLVYGFNVFEQALRWVSRAHYVSIAIPARKQRLRALAKKLHAMTGIGLIELSRYGDIEETIAPRFNRRAFTSPLKSCLAPEHKVCAAAGSTGTYWPPFNGTRKRFIRMVKAHPGRTMKELIEEMGKCHYASTGSARVSLARWVRDGVIEGVEIRHNGRRREYWPI